MVRQDGHPSCAYIQAWWDTSCVHLTLYQEGARHVQLSHLQLMAVTRRGLGHLYDEWVVKAVGQSTKGRLT